MKVVSSSLIEDTLIIQRIDRMSSHNRALKKEEESSDEFFADQEAEAVVLQRLQSTYLDGNLLVRQQSSFIGNSNLLIKKQSSLLGNASDQTSLRHYSGHRQEEHQKKSRWWHLFLCMRDCEDNEDNEDELARMKALTERKAVRSFTKRLSRRASVFKGSDVVQVSNLSRMQRLVTEMKDSILTLGNSVASNEDLEDWACLVYESMSAPSRTFHGGKFESRSKNVECCGVTIG